MSGLRADGVNVSIFIQTLDEETNLAACLASLSWADDIVVLDSFSHDGTEAIARSYGARWFVRKFEGRAAHQNWAMETIDFRHPWVFYVDADERVPPALAAEILRVTADPDNPHAAYRVRRRDHFEGRWLRRSTGYPLWIVRLFRPEKIRWTRRANPAPEVAGRVGVLENDYLHYPFSKGMTDWVWRHNRYSTYEAEETLRSLATGGFRWSQLWARDPAARRRALKTLSFRLPFRPLLKFIYFYGLRGGFLDGGPGFRYCVLQAVYEFLIVLKIREMRRGREGGGDGRDRQA